MVQRRVVVPVDPDRLWQALTDPDEAGIWLGGDLDWAPEEGRSLRFTPAGAGGPAVGGDQASGARSRPGGPPGTVREPVREGRVEEVVPGRYLRFVWWPEDGAPDSASEVVYSLEPLDTDGPSSEGVTILTVEETPAVPIGSASASATASMTLLRDGWSGLDDLQLQVWASRRLAGALAL